MSKLSKLCSAAALCVVVAACSTASLSTSYATFTVGGTVTGLDGNLTLTNNGVDTIVLTTNGAFAFAIPVSATQTYQVAIQSQPMGQTCTVQGGSGAVGTANVTSVVVACSASGAAYSVSGIVTGLPSGVALTLALSGQVVDVDSSNANFIFPQNVMTGTNYDIRVSLQPPGATCVVEGGVGTVQTRNITDVVVVCMNSHYSIAGLVSGLVSGDTLVLSPGTGSSVSVTGGGSGTDTGVLPGYMLYGQGYTLVVDTQPAHASCFVPVPTGTVTGNVTVPITCVRQSLPLNVAVAGLPTGGVVQLRNNGGAAVSVTGSGTGHDTATLDATALYNASYNVSVATSPPGYDCTVPVPTGAIVGLAPLTVNVTCTAATYVLQAQVSGLASGGVLELSVNGGTGTSIVGGGSMSDNANLTTAVAYNAPYSVAITSSPNAQACSITSGVSGTGGVSSPVVHVGCVTGYRLFVTVNGLTPHAAPFAILNTYGAGSATETLYVTDANNGVPVPFVTHLPANTTYTLTTPSSRGYQCAFGGTAASGTTGPADTTGIALTCSVHLSFTTQQAAAFVLGQGTMTQTSGNRASGEPTAASMRSPGGSPYVAPDGTLYIPDTGNARVLGYLRVPTQTGAPADFVLGQPNFSSTTQTTSANGFSQVYGLFGAGGTLFVTDYARALIYRTLPHSNVNADAVLGQPDFVTNTPNPRQNQDHCSVDQFQTLGAGGGFVNNANLLIFPDTIDNRVFLYDDYTQNSEPDVALGQGSPTNCFSTSGGPVSPMNMAHPTSVSLDGHRLFVADEASNRVMIWDDVTTLITGQNADHVIGQADLASGGSGSSATALSWPSVVLAANNQLFIVDRANNRVLIWNTAPSGVGVAYNTPPDAVLGQPDLNSNGCNTGGATASTLCTPRGLAIVGTSLYVVDQDNNRVLVFQSN